MMNQLFQPIPNMLIEALTISDQNKAFLYDIIKHGATGASTFDLQAEQHGNISAKVKKLRELGVVIHTVFRDVTDKRGNLRRGIAHHIFGGYDATVTGGY